jgi:hypothetical protein
MTATKNTASTSAARPSVTALTEPAAEAAIGAACRALHLPTIRAEATRIADVPARERLSHNRDNEPCRLLHRWSCVRVIDLGWRH